MQIHYDGYVGKNYNPNIPTKEIGKLCKEHIKKNWKGCKVSITTDHNEINVDLMEAPFTFYNMFEVHNFSDGTKRALSKGYMQVNHYYINEDERLSPKAAEFFKDIKQFLTNYNYVDQEQLTDYYNCNFYINFNIGKWNKPFIKK